VKLHYAEHHSSTSKHSSCRISTDIPCDVAGAVSDVPPIAVLFMLNLETSRLTDAQVVRRVTEACSKYGEVVEVRLQRRHGGDSAVVEMATANAAIYVREDFGDAIYGHYVMIELRPGTIAPVRAKPGSHCDGDHKARRY
jgi:hypothetical protein